MVQSIHHLSDTIKCQVTHPGTAQKTPFFFLRFTCLFWPCCVSTAACGLSLVAEIGGYSPAAARGLLIVVAPGLSYPSARAVFPDRGSNPRALHRQADSYPLDHQGRPRKHSFRSQLISRPMGRPWFVLFRLCWVFVAV